MFAIVGRPNVGKSTLVNALAGTKVAIVSDKPQTTRTRISAVVNKGSSQYVFLDTPGFHKPRTRLGDIMVGIVEETVADTDAVLLVVEPQPPGRQEELLLENVRAAGLPCILVINKIDSVPKTELLSVICAYQPLFSYHAVVPVSAKTGEGLDALLPELDALTQVGEALFPENMVTDQPEKAVIAELIREKLLMLLDREIPHGVAVEIESMEERENGVVTIHAMIYTEKESHKGIIIGKQGAMLKKIGELSRADIERFISAKVYLELWVKVKEGWRNNQYFMRNFGYE